MIRLNQMDLKCLANEAQTCESDLYPAQKTITLKNQGKQSERAYEKQ